MSAPVTVPRLGWTMEEGIFIEWLKKDGDDVHVGDPLFVLESDKSTETIEAIDAGILHIVADGPQPGGKVLVGQILGHLGGDPASRGREPSEVVPATDQASRRREPAEVRIVIQEQPPPAHAGGSPRSTPRARRAARERGIDWHSLAGTGRNGRVRERDVIAALPKDDRVVPLSPVRRAIAARMVAGVTQAAPVTLHMKVDATNLVSLREQYRAVEHAAPTYTDLILKLTACALSRHPNLQAQWRDEGLFIPAECSIALGVDTDSGLFAPVVRNVDRLILPQVMKETARLIALTRAGRLGAEEQRGATFTLTNLGMFNVDAFTPIITLPESAVLGVGRIVREPAVVEGHIVARQVMTLSLTFDHRVNDGGPAARFLDDLRRCLEFPTPYLMAKQE